MPLFGPRSLSPYLIPVYPAPRGAPRNPFTWPLQAAGHGLAGCPGAINPSGTSWGKAKGRPVLDGPVYMWEGTACTRPLPALFGVVLSLACYGDFFIFLCITVCFYYTVKPSFCQLGHGKITIRVLFILFPRNL